MAKKEAHAQALKMFIESKGKTPLQAIAKAVGVSSVSVSRWHQKENWKEQIGTLKAAPAVTEKEKVAPIKAAPAVKKRKSAESVVIRKKGLFDQAVKIFNESGGKISNVALAKQLDINSTSIARWKKMPQWSQAVVVTVSPEAVETTSPPEVAPPPLEVVSAPQAAEFDVETITSLQDLITLNERLRAMLNRDFLTAAEIEHLSNAKLSLLESAEVYLGIVKGEGE
jgi:hypothetical protein